MLRTVKESINVHFGYQNFQTAECRKWVCFVITCSLCTEKFVCLWCKVILLLCRLCVPTKMCDLLQFMSPLMARGNWEVWTIFVCTLKVFSLSYKKLFHIHMLIKIFKVVSIWEEHEQEAQYEMKKRRHSLIKRTTITTTTLCVVATAAIDTVC